MAQGCSVGIIGAGASGCMCAYFLNKAGIDVTLFDFGKPLRTILPTGGGRCNLAHAEYDFKELAKNYPRGEKFLYSVFSKFSTSDTLATFEEIGIETYTQDDDRIFPISNSSKDVREKFLSALKGVNFVNEKVISVSQLDNGFKLKTDKAEYLFSKIVVASGGGTKICGIEQHTIIPYKPSLVGLNCNIKDLSGLVLKNILAKDFGFVGDVLFTHYGISGPLVYKISSLKAREEFPYEISFDLYPQELDLQTLLDSNPHKEFKNVLSSIFPQRFADFITAEYKEIKAHKINGQIRDLILEKIHNFKLTITGTNQGEETVTAGGYDLDEINSKTMESKFYNGLYFIGETLDIDGFCGGFNLQNAWSTAFVCAENIINMNY